MTFRQTWHKVRDFAFVAWSQLTNLLLSYAYLVSLIVLYLCGLQEVNVINAVFLVYFIAFLIFPRLARIAWSSLVVYTEVVIVLQFLWQMAFAEGKDQPFWGLYGGKNLWLQLRFHLIILFFAVVQMNTYEHLAFREKMSDIKSLLPRIGKKRLSLLL